MAKIFTITPNTILKFLAGEKLRLLPSGVPVEMSADAKIVKSGYSELRNEFWVEISAGSFDEPSERRIPSEFKIESVK